VSQYKKYPKYKPADLEWLQSVPESWSVTRLANLVDDHLENTVFSYHVVRFVFSENIYHAYKKYLCNNLFVLNQFSKLAKGTTRQILGRFDFRSIRVVLPAYKEQEQITDFLDKKNSTN